MAEKQKNGLNEAQIIAFLQDIVNKIQTEEDPVELNQFRRLFKKVVPFHLRSYFAAYLLKQIYAGRAPRIQGSQGRGDSSNRGDQNGRGDRNDRNNRNDQNDRGDRNDRSKRNERNDRSDPNGRGDQSGRTKRGEGRQNDGRQNDGRQDDGRKRDGEGRSASETRSEPRPVLADDVSTTLFVSIGRNRRVYPRDLIGLIMQNVEIERDHVGDIRVLDNYSFVQVITEDAQKIIDALNEFEYRGRKLAVSFSRKKEESADATSADDAAPADDAALTAGGPPTADPITGDAPAGRDSFGEGSGEEYDDSAIADDAGYDEAETGDATGDVPSVGDGSAEGEADDNEENNTNV